MEGETSLGAFREVAMVRGGGPVCIGKFLPRSGTSGIAIWVRDLSGDGSNVKKDQGRTRRIPVAGDREEDAKSRGQFLAEVGSG